MARVYIAGPMTGIECYNFPAFHQAAADWRREGWEVTNPAEMDETLDGFNPKTDAAKPHEWYMRRDLPALCACDAMVGVKLSREVHKHKRDNLTDAAGYAECAQMIAERQGV